MVRRTPSIGQVYAECRANAINRVHELGNAFECEELALDGDEDRIGRNEGVQREQIECGRAVDDDERIIVTNRLDASTKSGFSVVLVYQFQVGGDEVSVGWDEAKAFETLSL